MLLEVVKVERCFGMSYVLEFQEHLFFRIPFTFHSLFFVNLLIPGSNKSCTQSPISLRLSMLSLIFSASHCPLNVTSGMVWTTNGIDCFNSTTRNAKIPLYKFPSSTFSPDWYCADFCKYISSIIKIQSQEKEPFS